MNVWLVTTGSSDVQLTSNEDWSDWWQEIKKSLYRLRFEPTRAIDDDEQPYRLPARVLGMAYDQLPDRVQSYLSFPLLQNFTQELKAKEIQIDQIIVLITDQGNIFPESERETKRCPYWQDTCQLYPILENYFRLQYPNASVKPLSLSPKSSDKGLDDWDAVLALVQQAIVSLEFETEPQTVYVSHQAGTPAISSAVQFVSLAEFGDRTRFLVSSEQETRPPEILPSSSYLKGIRKQEAKTLLDRHDYSGVKTLIAPYLQDHDTQVLLNAAIQWNFAKFQEFADDLKKLSDHDLIEEVKERSQHYWWSAYESVYLAIVRFRQKDTVDALFHSFRAIEGILTEWGIQQFQAHIKMEDDRPYLQTSILDEEQYFGRAKYKVRDGQQIPDNDIAKLKRTLEEKRDKQQDLVFYGLTLYTLFREVRPEWKTKCKDIGRFWDTRDGIAEKRNKVFHQLKGITEQELFEIWEVEHFTSWQDKMRRFANFVSEQSFDHLDTLDSEGEAASLMLKVHQKLESAIASL